VRGAGLRVVGLSAMTLNDLLFKGETGLDCCYDRPYVEIAWDQWSRTRIWCKHGVFEGISDFMDLSEGVERAMAGFRASIATGIHNGCWQDCPAPEEWVDAGDWEAGAVTECDMVRGHDGEHRCFPDDAAEKAYWAPRRVYYVNGHDVTGERDMPKPIGSFT